MTTRKTHNRPTAVEAKVDLRTRVLWQVKPARVLDVFCGLGEMYRRVWHQADSYVGIDLEWSADDERRRFVGSNLRVLRAIDLANYNVFDFDAFGSPWEQAIIVADRRHWPIGERGAIVVTDGSGMRLKMGGVPSAMSELLGISRHSGLAPAGGKEGLARMALRAWAKRAAVEVVAEWQAYSARGTTGAMPMVYMAMVFKGSGAPQRQP